MAKPEWGLKRTCQGCGARFYDLGRSSIVCPKCGVEFDPEVVLKTRRTKPQAVAPRPAPAPAVVEEIEPIEEEVIVGEEADEKEEAAAGVVIEDTSELGEDKDDVAEVIENVDKEEER
ncbi:MAG: TIGR02300 family protein [Pseudomonadota bacterium]